MAPRDDKCSSSRQGIDREEVGKKSLLGEVEKMEEERMHVRMHGPGKVKKISVNILAQVNPIACVKKSGAVEEVENPHGIIHEVKARGYN